MNKKMKKKILKAWRESRIYRNSWANISTTYPKISRLDNCGFEQDDMADVYSVELKYDGSNIDIALDHGTIGKYLPPKLAVKLYKMRKDWPLIVSSRSGRLNDKGLSNAWSQVCKAYDGCLQERIAELLMRIENTTGCRAVIYGELMQQGRSPTGIIIHERADFKVFDVAYVRKSGLKRFFDRNLVVALFEDNGLLEIMGTTIGMEVFDTYGQITDYIDGLKPKIDEMGIEGVVFKSQSMLSKRIVFKVKSDKLPKRPKKMDKPKEAEKEFLPAEKVMNIIRTSHQELGSNIHDKSIAMNRIVALVKEDCKEHNCLFPSDVYKLYSEYVKAVK